MPRLLAVFPPRKAASQSCSILKQIVMLEIPTTLPARVMERQATCPVTSAAIRFLWGRLLCKNTSTGPVCVTGDKWKESMSVGERMEEDKQHMNKGHLAVSRMERKMKGNKPYNSLSYPQRMRWWFCREEFDVLDIFHQRSHNRSDPSITESSG